MIAGIKERAIGYLEGTKPVLIILDSLKLIGAFVATLYGWDILDAISQRPDVLAVLHRRIIHHPDFGTAHTVYFWVVTIAALTNSLWLLGALRNLVRFSMLRNVKTDKAKEELEAEKIALPEYPYKREDFAVVLAELQDRDGMRVPNQKSPESMPRWLILPEKALYTGVFVTGGIGSGKTASAAQPALYQMIGHQRPIQVVRGGREETELFQWSGLVTDEKGDFCSLTLDICKEWGRENDFIRIAPKGKIKWNCIYNPGQPTWAVGYTLGKILKRFNKGGGGSDPFWENAPKELLMDYLTLIDDAEGYYSISDYLQVLIREDLQDALHEKARENWKHDKARLTEIDRRWSRIQGRREDLGVNLMGSLQACAKAGLSLFDYPEIRETFSPTADEYWTGPACPWPKRVPRDEREERSFNQEHERGILLPRENIFTGFDAILDKGKIVGLDMPKTLYYDAANFVQIALKAAWQDAVFRRDTRDAAGNMLVPPRFGPKVGYCPTFLFADECQETVDPNDQNFMAQCRSKRASCWWLTQSHTSIISAMGSGKEKDAEAFFQNAMTHIYFRQSDLQSMEMIEKEVGLKDVAKTSVSITEGGQQSELSYVHGQFVNQNLAVSETKSVQIEEKPFFEKAQLKELPDFVSVVIPSTGERILPATVAFMRPRWLYKAHPDLDVKTSWHDWPESLRKRVTLDNVPQKATWEGWKHDGPIDLDATGGAAATVGGWVGARILAPADAMKAAPSPAPVVEDPEPLEASQEAPGAPQDSSPTMERDKGQEAPDEAVEPSPAAFDPWADLQEEPAPKKEPAKPLPLPVEVLREAESQVQKTGAFAEPEQPHEQEEEQQQQAAKEPELDLPW